METVTLAFKGDSSSAVDAMKDVGSASDKMGQEVGASADEFKKVGSAADAIGGSIDTTGSKAGDMESGFRGVTDSMSGFAAIAQGDVLGGLTDLAGGVEALATGFNGVILPALKNSVTWLGNTRVGMLAQAAAARVSQVASIGLAGAQRILNAVMRANPIMIVVGVLAALTGAFAILWEKSAGFRRFFISMWNGIKDVVGSVVRWIGRRWDDLVGFFSKLPGRIGRAMGSLASVVSNVFKGAVNGAVDGLNWFLDNTVNWLIRRVNDLTGIIGIPAIPEIPKIPRMHIGGIVPGSPGENVPIMAQAGEKLSARGQGERTVYVDLGPEIMRMIRKAVKAEGGDVQIVLGSGT